MTIIYSIDYIVLVVISDTFLCYRALVIVRTLYCFIIHQSLSKASDRSVQCKDSCPTKHTAPQTFCRLPVEHLKCADVQALAEHPRIQRKCCHLETAHASIKSDHSSMTPSTRDFSIGDGLCNKICRDDDVRKSTSCFCSKASSPRDL